MLADGLMWKELVGCEASCPSETFVSTFIENDFETNSKPETQMNREILVFIIIH